MNILNISVDPITKLQRRLIYGFMIDPIKECITIRCYISHHDESGQHIVNARTVDYVRDLKADNKTLVRASDGHIYTVEEKAADGFDIGSPNHTTQYKFYKGMASVPVILSKEIEKIIMLRVDELMFDI